MTNIDKKYKNCYLLDTFESYKEGSFSEEANPIRETHFTVNQIHQGPWTVISTHHLDSHPAIKIQWIITKKGKRKVLKQTGNNLNGIINLKYFIKRYILRRNISPLIFFPAIVVGDELLHNYKVDINFQPLSKKDLCGVLFRSTNSMQHYICGLKNNRLYLIKRNFNSLSILAAVKFTYECQKTINLSVETFNDQINCFIEGQKIISANDESYKYGKCGILSNVPAIFESFSVNMQSEENKNYLNNKQRKIHRCKKLISKYPGMRLVKKVDLPAKCSGRSIRFGDLNGEGQVDYLIVHGIHWKNDINKKISITATDSNGNVLWQKGEPNKDDSIFPQDVPVQIYDIDNDGNNEVICEFGNFLQILDGKNGNVKHQIESPRIHFDNKSIPTILDSLYICNLSGKSRPEDFLAKDMYSNIYAYDCNLNHLWSYQCNTGHYPYTYDISGNGRDDILVGYTLLDSNGMKKWELKLKDHADAVAIFRSHVRNKNIVAIAASDEGFIIADISGQIIKHLRIGHMQTITVAKLIPNSKDYQIATNTYWGNPGVIYILDFKGNILNIFHPSVYGSPISPVKWTNDDYEFILLSAYKGYKGGLYNGLGDQVVSFPDDDHPFLCYYVNDIDNDGLDEIVCYDHERLWIYESEISNNSNKNKIRRFPKDYNQSNYRSNISMR